MPFRIPAPAFPSLVLTATLATTVLATSAQAQSLMTPGPAADAYAFIESNGYGIETPDCKHDVRHIGITTDPELGRPVFAFTIHRDLDDDRCINFDRQRMEIKTWDKSPANMTGANGETHTYSWKFKLDAGFKPSASFTHIHQIKAQGGSDDDAPIITITPRAGSPEKLQIIHVPSGGGGGVVAEANLSLFKGVWVEVEEKVKYGDKGSIQIVIRRARDKTPLLTYSDAELDTWRADAALNRPKYGIYRSLNDKGDLRDETVLFTDFCLAEGTSTCGGLSSVILSPRTQADRFRSISHPVLVLLTLDGRTVRPESARRISGMVVQLTPGHFLIAR